MSTPQLTTAEAIVSSLMAHGVDTVFGIPGAHTYPLIDAITREPSIRFVTARHEQGAAYMALGYAKSTGRVGVFTVVPARASSTPPPRSPLRSAPTPRSSALPPT